MKILIIIPKYTLEIEPNYDYSFPIGLAYIFSVVKKEKYDVDCINLNHIKGTSEQILFKKLNQTKYDVVMTGGNTLIYNSLKAISKTVKTHITKPLLIIGGPVITSEPQLMVDSLKPDYAVIGEGEITIVELLNSIKKNKSPEKVKGLVFRDNSGKFIITPSRDFIKNIEKIPEPDFDSFEFNKQLDNMYTNTFYFHHCLDNPRTYPLLGARGCPFSCSFCWHHMKYRKRSIKDIMKELEKNIPKYRINNIVVYDDCFSATKDRVYDFCKGITELQKKINWPIKWTCQLMVSSVDSDLLKVMKQAGCESISYGFESYHPDVLRSMKKPITPEQINKALHATLKAKIAVQAHFILGDIAETLETSKTTINYWKNVCKGQVGLGFVQPYPGSDLYKHCIKNKIIKDKLYYIENEMGPFNSINMTKSISDEDFHKLEKHVLTSFGKYVRFVKPISIKSDNKFRNTYKVYVKCPFCKSKLHYKNCLIKNKYTYGFLLICRNCAYRFFVVSPIQKIAYKYYSISRKIRNYYKRLRDSLKKKKL
jgi:anaerobic magnesium-protoporphyrin IX monomethyl ester cyclase